MAGLVTRRAAGGRGYSRLLAAVLLAYAGHASALSTTKTFTPDNIATNATSNLRIALTHTIPLNNLTITDNFPTTPGSMTLANATTTNSCNGTLTDSSGGSLAAGDTGIRLNNGSLTALLNPVCNFTVNVTANAAGTYTNTTGTPSGATLALLPTTGTGASANLYVYDPLVISKYPAWMGRYRDHIEVGGDAMISYDITNPAANPGTLSNITFTDSSYDTASNPKALRLVAGAVYTSGCGTGATANANATTGTITVTNVTLAPGATCTITPHVTGVRVGTYSAGSSLNATNLTTSTGGAGSTKTVNLGTITSGPATIVVGPLLNVSKNFTASFGAGTDSNVQTNVATALAVQVQTFGATSPITNLAISDAFPTSPGAMTLADTTSSNSCSGTLADSGGGSLSAGDLGIKLTGGSIPEGPASCAVTVNVKAATRGNYNNNTSAPSGTYVYHASGQAYSTPGTSAAATGAAASDTLSVYDPPTFTKSFNNSTIAAGATSVLTFTITNPSGNPGTLSGVSFTDNLPTSPGQMRVAATPSVTTPLPASCGSGAAVSAAANATAISFSGGTLAPGASCTFNVTVTASAVGTYANSATLDNTGPGTTMSVNTGGGKINFTAVTASANLVVNAPPTITKTITPSQVNLLGTATLTYTITNPASNPSSFTDLAFNDVYPTPGFVRVNRTNAVPGYTSSGCGSATISVSNPGNYTKYSGGMLAPGQTCTISVILTGVAYGLYSDSVTLTTGQATITSNVASLLVTPLSVDKSFPAANGTGTDNNVQTNAATSLAIKLTNAGTALSGLSIADTFPTTPGAMTSANTTVSNTCGGSVTDDGGSALGVGDTGIKLNNGTLAASASCTVTANVKANTRGTYVNTTGSLSSTSGASGAPDSDSLNVYDPPVFSKSFSPSTIAAGDTAVLTFTITNPSGNPGTISNFSFTDVLPTTPGPMKVAATPGLVTCGTGTLTAAANASSISYSGGSLAPGASCTLQVNVTASASGTYANSVALANTGAGNLANVNTGGGKVSFSTVTATSNLTVAQTNPVLSAAKTVSVLNDPINGGSNPKAIPGATMVYSITVSNTGPGSISADSTVITDPVPANLTLCTGNGSGSSGLTVAFIDGSGGNASGLTALAAGDISYSSTAGGGAPFTYAPAANTCDPAITGLRINPKGSMSGASGGNTPTFTLQFKTTVR